MKPRVHYATIGTMGRVAYRHTDAAGETTTTDTQHDVERFDWSQLPKSCPVIDLRGAEQECVWRVCCAPQYPSVSARLDACRDAGFRVTDVRRVAGETARAYAS